MYKWILATHTYMYEYDVICLHALYIVTLRIPKICICVFKRWKTVLMKVKRNSENLSAFRLFQSILRECAHFAIRNWIPSAFSKFSIYISDLINTSWQMIECKCAWHKHITTGNYELQGHNNEKLLKYD